MSNDFEFGLLDLDSSKKNINTNHRNILFHHENNNKNNHLLFLLESTDYDNNQIKGMVTWISNHIKGFDYDIVASTPLEVTTDFIKKRTIYKFYDNNSSDFNQYIKINKTIVIPLGIALSAITKSGDLTTECFYDYIFNKTYFYSPQTGTYVFPIDGFDTLFKKNAGPSLPLDSSRVQFALYQLGLIKKNYDKLCSPPDPERRIINIVKNSKDFIEMININKDEPKLAKDLETGGFNFRKDPIGCMTVSYDGKSGWFVPWEYVDKEVWSNHIKNKYQIYQNGKFDVKFCKFNGITNLHIDSDTLQLGQTLNEIRYNSLKSLAYYYGFHGGYDKPLDDYISKWHPNTYLDIESKILIPYATEDAIETFNADSEMQKQLTWIDNNFPPIHENGWLVRDFYEKIKIPSVNTFVNIEMRGFSIDVTKWETNSRILQSKINVLKQELEYDFNIKSSANSESSFDTIFFNDEDFLDNDKSDLQSSQKLGRILESLNWECLGRAKALGKNKIGTYLTGDDILKRWSQLGHPEASKIQSLRSYLTLQKTFMGVMTDPKTGWQYYIEKFGDGDYRICPSYKSMMTETMRNACGDPNYQQMPSQAQDARLFKEVISVPDINKYYLVTLDYASLQMRLATIDSEDEVLMEAYKKNPDLDLHTKTGFNIFCKGLKFDINQVTITDKGKTLVMFPNEEIKVLRNNSEITIKVSDLKESDSLL
jgi:DNA polymerase I-like protein with 3'-5' exonuclease and polymerase domains